MDNLEEKKNKKYIIVIVILVILLLGSIGYIVYDKFIKEDETVENNELNNQQEENDENDTEEEQNNNEENKLSEEEKIAIIKKELGDIFDYINDTKEANFFEDEDNGYLNACMLLGTDIYEPIEDIFEIIGPLIMDCYYNHDYLGFTEELGGGALLTDEQIADYDNYFETEFHFSTFTPINPSYYQSSGYSEWYEIIKKEYELYNGKNYKIAYTYGDGFGVNPNIFEIVDIYKKNDKYIVETKITMNEYNNTNIYNGKIEVEIVDGHSKFGTFKIG